MHHLEREVRRLRVQTTLLTAACAVLFLTSFLGQETERPSFQEIDVERINVVEADGSLRMVISNRERQHPGIMNGEVTRREHPRPPGMIFFNQHGDEMGGLVFGANGDRGHFGSLTFDKVGNDQTLGFRYLESDDGSYLSGIQMWQQPDIPAQRMISQIEEAQALEDAGERAAALQALRDRN